MSITETSAASCHAVFREIDWQNAISRGDCSSSEHKLLENSLIDLESIMESSPKEFSQLLISLVSRGGAQPALKKLSLLKVIEILGLSDDFRQSFLGECNQDDNIDRALTNLQNSASSSNTTSHTVSTSGSLYSHGIHNFTYFVDKQSMVKHETYDPEDEGLSEREGDSEKNKDHDKKEENHHEEKLKVEVVIEEENLTEKEKDREINIFTLASLGGPTIASPTQSSSTGISNLGVGEARVIEYMASFVSSSILSMNSLSRSAFRDFEVHLTAHLNWIATMLGRLSDYFVNLAMTSPPGYSVSSPAKRLNKEEVVEYSSNLSEAYLVMTLLGKLIRSGQNRQVMWNTEVPLPRDEKDKERERIRGEQEPQPKGESYAAFFLRHTRQLIDLEGLKNDPQWVYLTLSTLWAFSFDLNLDTRPTSKYEPEYKERLQCFLSDGLIKKLVDCFVYSPVKKNNRLVIGLLRNLCLKESDKVITQLLSLGFLKVLQRAQPGVDLDFEGETHSSPMLKGKMNISVSSTTSSSNANGDEDYEADLSSLSYILSKNFKELTSFEMWQNEVDNESFAWGILHTKKFWQMNCKKMEWENFTYIKKLIQILDRLYSKISHSKSEAKMSFMPMNSHIIQNDLTKMSIILSDLGEFTRYYPNGRVIFNRLEGKEIVMKIFEGVPDEQTQKFALECISKAVISNWEHVRG